MKGKDKAVTTQTLQPTPPCVQAESSSSEEWSARARRLQDALAACPTDILARCELATVLEELGQSEEALFNWKAVLSCDPNNLKAWEGMARCRQKTGRAHGQERRNRP